LFIVLFIVLSFIEIKQLNLAQLCRPRACINRINFVRIVQGLVKFKIFKVLGLQTHTPKPIKVKFDIEERFLSFFTFIGPKWGGKPKNRFVSKNNTDRAALWAVLPVIIIILARR